MLPSELNPESFRTYPPEARQLAIARITLLQKLPLTLLGLLLRELIAYDWRFPAERRELDNQFAYLTALSSDQLQATMAPFAALKLSPELSSLDWINLPSQFSEQLTAHLWATHQIDAFRTAAINYVHAVNAAAEAPAMPLPRLAIVVLGSGLERSTYPLFRKLRPHGVYFDRVNPDNGWSILAGALAERASSHSIPFGHWYIGGAGNLFGGRVGLTCISYDALQPIRDTLVARMRKVMQPGGGGPEVLRTMLAQMAPEEVGLRGDGEAVLSRFQLSILTEGSGTQLFSTTFVQWSAREALRRAQPVTLLAHFTPRQREQSMNDLLAGKQHQPVPDPQGSLIDADMGAYYTWINQQRLPGAERSSFLAWFENHNEALAISPALDRGKEDHTAVDLHALLARL